MMRWMLAAFFAIGSICTSTSLVQQAPTETATESAPTAPAAMERAIPTATALPACEVTADFLNIRSGPGVEYAGIGSLKSGDVVTVTVIIKSPNGVLSDWLQISAGYINGSFCKWR